MNGLIAAIYNGVVALATQLTNAVTSINNNTNSARDNINANMANAGGAKLRYTEFKVSGTFTPSAKLIANGGQCEVLIVAGGGGGGTGNSSWSAYQNGAAGGSGYVRISWYE